jgi:hypothetical protein
VKLSRQTFIKRKLKKELISKVVVETEKTNIEKNMNLYFS